MRRRVSARDSGKQRQPPRVGLRAQLLERAVSGRGLGQLLLPGGHHQQQPPRRDPARHEGQQPQRHLVCPVQVFQHQQDRLPRRQPFHKLGHALEEPELVVPGRR